MEDSEDGGRHSERMSLAGLSFETAMRRIWKEVSRQERLKDGYVPEELEMWR